MTRIIVGTELSRDEEFLAATNSYFGGSFLTGFIMLKLPFVGRIRDTVAWPLCKYHQVFHQNKVLNMIKPVVAQRMVDHANGKIGNGQLDAVTCTLNMISKHPFDPSSAYTPLHTLSHETLQLVWAAGQSPAMSMATVVFKLLECPEYVQPLRKEAHAAISKHGWNDPIFNELPMMDSFIRETHRMYPAFSCKPNSSSSSFVTVLGKRADDLDKVNATRCVQGKPFTFSDGLTLPVGTRIAFPAEALQRDPKIIENPAVFDGFRFVKLAAADKRQEDGVNYWHASHCSFSNLT
jgi:hypothetical protein